MRSSKGKVYYFHQKTEISQWDEPGEWKQLERGVGGHSILLKKKEGQEKAAAFKTEDCGGNGVANPDKTVMPASDLQLKNGETSNSKIETSSQVEHTTSRKYELSEKQLKGNRVVKGEAASLQTKKHGGNSVAATPAYDLEQRTVKLSNFTAEESIKEEKEENDLEPEKQTDAYRERLHGNIAQRQSTLSSSSSSSESSSTGYDSTDDTNQKVKNVDHDKTGTATCDVERNTATISNSMKKKLNEAKHYQKNAFAHLNQKQRVEDMVKEGGTAFQAEDYDGKGVADQDMSAKPTTDHKQKSAKTSKPMRRKLNQEQHYQEYALSAAAVREIKNLRPGFRY